jgi:flagellar biosynthesis/type III secretory pathway protein FliH
MDSRTQRRYERDIASFLKSKFDNYDKIVEAVSDFIASAFDDGYDEGNENGYEEGYDEGTSSKQYIANLSEKQENHIFRELDNLTKNTDLTNKIMDIIKEGLEK